MLRFPIPLFAILSLLGCPEGTGGSDAGDGDGDTFECTEAQGTYCFKSRFAEANGVSYGGQATRHLLISELKAFIGQLDETQYTAASAQDVIDDFHFLYDYKNSGGDGSDTVRTSLPGEDELEQTTLGEVGLASLQEKLAGVDNPFATGVVGWGDGSSTPEQVLDGLFAQLADLVIARAQGTYEQTPAGVDIDRAYVSAAGVDYQQLIQKFLDGAVAYSQGTDDYLDDDTDGKGLKSDNVLDDDGEGFTALEHAWDEGFGYWGAARDFDAYTDDEVAGKGGRPEFANGHHDTDGNGAIDWSSEVNHGHAVNAAKRDRGRCAGAETDFSGEGFSAFLAGRELIASASGALDANQSATLAAHRDDVLTAWEDAIAATVVHYINDTLADVAALGTESYAFYDHAKHWSELKGFAFALQFNPHKRISDAQLAEVHAGIGDGPELDPANAAFSTTALENARLVLQAAYGFSDDNLGVGADGCGW